MGECEINYWSCYNLHFHYHLIYPNDTKKIVALDTVLPSNRNPLWSSTHWDYRHLHVVLDMLMRQLLAGLHSGSLHLGPSQIEIKLYPEPPKKMPMGLNNNHLTRKPFDYHRHSLSSLGFFGTHFHMSFCFQQEERVEGKTLSTWGICYMMDMLWGLPHIIPQEFLRNQPVGKTGMYGNNYNVNCKGEQWKDKNKHLLSSYQVECNLQIYFLPNISCPPLSLVLS